MLWNLRPRIREPAAGRISCADCDHGASFGRQLVTVEFCLGPVKEHYRYASGRYRSELTPIRVSLTARVRSSPPRRQAHKSSFSAALGY